jgi:hypothetical protein
MHTSPVSIPLLERPTHRNAAPNLVFWPVDMVDLMDGTPFSVMFDPQSGEPLPGALVYEPGRLPYVLGNMFRFAALFKYGGIYFDMDMIMLRSVGIMGTPFALGYEREGGATPYPMGSAVMIFREPGHLYLLEVMRRIVELKGTGSRRGSNCVSIMSDVRQKHPESFQGITLLSFRTFFPIYSGLFYMMHDESSREEVLERLGHAQVRGVHLWNNRHRKNNLTLTSDTAEQEGNSAMAHLLRDQCHLETAAKYEGTLKSRVQYIKDNVI